MKPQTFFIQPEKTLVVLFSSLIIGYVLFYGYFRYSSLLAVPLDLLTFTVLLPILLIDGIKTTLESLTKKTFHHLAEDSEKISVIIPTHNGEKTIRATLNNLVNRFDRENIIVSSNGSTDATCQIASTYHVSILEIDQPVGKVEAINQALSKVTTPYVIILDDDTLIGNAVIPTNLLDQGYSAVAFRVLPIKTNWITTLQLHEYRKSMDVGRSFHNSTGTVQTVSGAIGLFNTQELIRQIFLHSGEFSGEDLQRTLLVHLAERKKGVVLADSTVKTLAPNSISQLFWQRVLGWYPGQLATLHIYRKLLFHKNVPLRLRYEALYTLILVTAIEPLRVLTLPVVLLSPVFLIITYLSYVLMELIPYFSLGKKEPFWVVLVSPVYGLGNSLCRMIAIVVFFYRRTTYFLGRGEKYDDYKHVHFVKQSLSAALVFIFTSSFILMQSFLLMTNQPFAVKLEIPIPHVKKEDTLIKPVPELQPVVESIVITASPSADTN